MTFWVVCQEGPFIFFLKPSHQVKDIKIWSISRMGYYFKEFHVSKGSGFILGCLSRRAIYYFFLRPTVIIKVAHKSVLF